MIKKIHFQWIPSHIGLSGNELADNLSKKGMTIITKNNKIPLTSVKTLIRTKSDHRTKKQQSEIAQTKIWKNTWVIQ